MEKRHATAVLLAALLVIALAATGASIYYVPYWVMNALPVSPSALAEVTPGTPMAAVRNKLGEPYQVSVRDCNEEEWTYASSWKWTSVIVAFKDGKVTSLEVDR